MEGTEKSFEMHKPHDYILTDCKVNKMKAQKLQSSLITNCDVHFKDSATVIYGRKQV